MGEATEGAYLSLRERKRQHVNATIGKVKPIVKDWFLDVAYKLIQSRNFTAQEEALLEEVSDYYLRNLATL